MQNAAVKMLVPKRVRLLDRLAFMTVRLMFIRFSSDENIKALPASQFEDKERVRGVLGGDIGGREPPSSHHEWVYPAPKFHSSLAMSNYLG